MTGEELLNISLDLCGLRKNDSTLPADTEDLKQRAVSLINIILAENAVLDGRIRKTEHAVASITALTDRIDCCEIVANNVLPYGLARLFMLGEDDAFAADMNKLYINAQSEAIKFGKAKAMPIEEVYG